jgi:hypothetical protein
MKAFKVGKPEVIISIRRKPKKASFNSELSEYRRPKKEKAPSMDWLINQLLEGKQR